jgi:hypothetical protein
MLLVAADGERPVLAEAPPPPSQLEPTPATAAQPDAQAPPSPQELPPVLTVNPGDTPPAAAAADPEVAAGVHGADVAPEAGAAAGAAAAAAPVSYGDTSTAGLTAPPAQQLQQDMAGPAATQAESPQDAAAAPESAVPRHASDGSPILQGDAAATDAANVNGRQQPAGCSRGRGCSSGSGASSCWRHAASSAAAAAAAACATQGAEGAC